jgi:hypothetical protein
MQVSVRSRTCFRKHKMMAEVGIYFDGQYKVDPRLAPQFLLTS